MPIRRLSLGKLFCHIETGSGFDPRFEEIPSYIMDYFLNKMGNKPTFYILDPYLDPYEMLYKHILEKRFDNKPYIKIIKNFYEINPSVELKVLTEFDLKHLKDVLPKESKFPNYYAQFYFETFQGKFEIVQYPAKKGKFPQVLHDRWIILKCDDKFCGLHLGPSLDDYKNKDCTITIFDDNSAKEAGERFEHIWGIFAGWINEK